MGSDLWAGETIGTPRVPLASGKEIATAKFLTSEHAERGGDGGMCSFWRGEFLGRSSSWVNLLKHPQKWHIRQFCPRALKEKKSNDLLFTIHKIHCFKNTFNDFFIPLDFSFQGFSPATEYSALCLLRGWLSQCKGMAQEWSLREHGLPKRTRGFRELGQGGSFAYITNYCLSDIINNFVFLELWENGFLELVLGLSNSKAQGDGSWQRSC